MGAKDGPTRAAADATRLTIEALSDQQNMLGKPLRIPKFQASVCIFVYIAFLS
jgi:hypothetical protein